MAAVPEIRPQDLRYTPGTREYDDDQAMWRIIHAARHETMSYLGTAPRIAVSPVEFCAAA